MDAGAIESVRSSLAHPHVHTCSTNDTKNEDKQLKKIESSFVCNNKLYFYTI